MAAGCQVAPRPQPQLMIGDAAGRDPSGLSGARRAVGDR